jgi:hypothetical protein
MNVAAAFAATNLDGDRISDLPISDAGSGRLYLAFGRKEWPSRPGLRGLGAVRLFEAEEGGGAGGIAIGDIDADRVPEIVLSSHRADGAAQTRRVLDRGYVGAAGRRRPHRRGAEYRVLPRRRPRRAAPGTRAGSRG